MSVDNVGQQRTDSRHQPKVWHALSTGNYGPCDEALISAATLNRFYSINISSLITLIERLIDIMLFELYIVHLCSTEE